MRWLAPMLFALAVPFSIAALAEQKTATPSATELAWLHGNWEGQGTLLGKPATANLSIGLVLNGTATGLSYRALVSSNDVRPKFEFEGRGTYRVTDLGRVTGQWSDSAGNFHPLAGKVSGHDLQIQWGEARTELGHSSYTLGQDGTLTVVDSVFSKGAVREFARFSYRRKV